MLHRRFIQSFQGVVLIHFDHRTLADEQARAPLRAAQTAEKGSDLRVRLYFVGSQQIDYVRAARLLGIPSCLPVWSWDHLTSKAYLRDRPERVLVWNETRRREAIDVHGVPDDRVIVTGAQCFDHWFTRPPSRTRETLCAELGFDPQKPIVLYVCTGLIKGSPREPQFVREWLQTNLSPTELDAINIVAIASAHHRIHG